MRKLNKIQSTIFAIGALFMVTATFMYVLRFMTITASIIFIIGAIGFTLMQSLQTYDGNDPTIKRLRRIMSLADLFFVLAGIFMLDTAMSNAAGSDPNAFTLFRQLFNSYIDYYTYLYNKWFPMLIIATMLEVYSTLRLSHELGKEEKKS